MGESQKLIEIKNKLIELAKRKTWTEDGNFDPHNIPDANFAGAYFGGYADGRTELAREVIKMINA